MAKEIRSQLEPHPFVASLEQRLKRFRDGRAFVSYSESADFAAALGDWLDDTERHGLPANPEVAWQLIDRFIQADGRILERADDSGGWIGDVFRRACSLWHRAAAVLPRAGGGGRRLGRRSSLGSVVLCGQRVAADPQSRAAGVSEECLPGPSHAGAAGDGDRGPGGGSWGFNAESGVL